MEPRAEEQVVEAARRGDVESFAVLYRRYYATLVWLATICRHEAHRILRARKPAAVCPPAGGLPEAPSYDEDVTL